MNPDQRRNLEEMVEALCNAMFGAWEYFHILQGFHEGAKLSPAVVGRFGRLFEEIWRGLFDAFFAKVGTIVDSTRSTKSLPNLITLVNRYGDEGLKELVPEAQACLSDKTGPLAKIANWRHQQVAHHTSKGREAAFHLDNKMSLVDLESALKQLDEAINHLSWHVLSIHNDNRAGSAALIDDGRALFEFTAKGLAENGK